MQGADGMDVHVLPQELAAHAVLCCFVDCGTKHGADSWAGNR